MKNTALIPIKNAWVRHTSDENNQRPGRVSGWITEDAITYINVRWKGETEDSSIPHKDLRCGFKIGMDVQEHPSSKNRKSLGEGITIRMRTLGGCDQVLVDFPRVGKQMWLPYENLRQVKGIRHRFTLSDFGPENAAELFRLKSLAYALELWNENTGSLSTMDIDPLPHQINLVHHILESGSLNWLIADDVGLGKTIETGMLLAALKQRDMLKRVLLITPAGLTKQWQEEMHYKFSLSEFEIYGEDFTINEARHWKMHDQVIASMDRLKNEDHLESILQAEPWDIIIFDEAHRLSRRQYGNKINSSQRFKLAAKLRENTDSMILLSATPHQGMHDKFQALLELLHPERKNEISTLAINPQIISDMVFRNNKADVTDAEGNFIFQGKITRALKVEISEAAIEFDKSLQSYLKKGYSASSALGFKGNAIGFVMTVYRKLAASSIAAIKQALIRRKLRLQGQLDDGYSINNLDEYDQRFLGEFEEQLETDTKEFFEGEIELLDELIEEAEILKADDKKISVFLENIITPILEKNPEEKVLIFTEYRTTQDYLKAALEKAHGNESVELINGSIPHQTRREAITRFEEDAQFLISTEAGGEGINLQRQCHIMVNYDLPWNPMRLVQRIGRLYRYGQKVPVVVFNIHSPETADERIVETMYARLEQVVTDLSTIGGEYNEKLSDDILGEIADLVDISEILNKATKFGIDRTEDRINDALQLARDSVKKQRELFEYAASFDPNESRDELRITSDHSKAFIEGMFEQLEIEIVERTHKDLVWHIRLPENIQEKLGLSRSRYEITHDRTMATQRPGTHMMDMDSNIMKYLLTEAKSYNFMGLTAVIESDEFNGQALMTNLLRWQNEQGRRMRQEFTTSLIQLNNQIITNPSTVSDWLLKPAKSGKVITERSHNAQLLKMVEKSTNQRLAEVSNRYLHPENQEWISACWIGKDSS